MIDLQIGSVGKVLVIDDDAATCGLIEKVLTRQGLEVVTSPDPLAGIESAREIIPDLIFIGLLLSDTNGLKMSKAIHAVKGLESVPVIMLISRRGELDPKYTKTIGIVDTLVKPLKEAEIIEKTKAVLGDIAFAEAKGELAWDISPEDEMEAMILQEKEALSREAAGASVMKSLGEPVKKEDTEPDERKIAADMTKEGELHMPEKENPFERKKEADRDLFTDESDSGGEELESPAERRGKLLQGEQEDSFSESEEDLSYGEEKPVSPVRRILMIAASVVVGIGLGVGGYFFFTAGSKQAPVEKKIAKTLPEPAPTLAPAVMPSDKPNLIPEIPVRPEPEKTETAPAKNVKPQEFLPKQEAKKAPLQKAEAEKPTKKTVPATGDKSEKKLPLKRAAKKEASVAIQGKGPYYVQAGLFEHEKNAHAIAAKIRQKGFTPTITKITKAQETLYRVTVGNFGSFKKAAEVSETLRKNDIQAIVKKQ